MTRTLPTLCLLFCFTLMSVAVAGTKEDVWTAAKSSFGGGLLKSADVNASTATLTYDGNDKSFWSSGSAKEKVAVRCIATVLRKVAGINTVHIVIGGYSAKMTRKQAESFFGAFMTDTDFRKNVTDGVMYDKSKLSAFNSKYAKGK